MLRHKQIIGLGGGEVSSDWFSLSACCLQHTLPLAGLAARLASGPQGPALPLTMSKCSCVYFSVSMLIIVCDFWMSSCMVRFELNSFGFCTNQIRSAIVFRAIQFNLISIQSNLIQTNVL